jgi:hypothetical protein
LREPFQVARGALKNKILGESLQVKKDSGRATIEGKEMNEGAEAAVLR